jgi:hypothetical protein
MLGWHFRLKLDFGVVSVCGESDGWRLDSPDGSISNFTAVSS